MNPHDNPELYESIVLGDKKSPGIVTLSGHDRTKDWDIKGAKGQVGASSSLNGDPIGGFQASFQLVKDVMMGVDEFTLWDEFQRHIESLTNGPTPIAMPIYHPDLARNHYTEVSGAFIGGMLHDGLGGGTVQVKFIEHRPPKPKPPSKAKSKASGNTANTTSSGAHQPPKEDPNKAAKEELAGLLQQAKEP